MFRATAADFPAKATEFLSRTGHTISQANAIWKIRLCAGGLTAALDRNLVSADAVRQKARIPGNGAVHLDDEFRGSGRAYRRLLENEEVGTTLRHRQGFASGQEELHFDMC